MKKIFLALLIFCVWVSIALGGMVIQKVSSNGGCDANCPSATYKFLFNGDHSTAEEYCCKTDCAASQDHVGDDGTDRIHNDYGQTGQGFRVTTTNQYIYWAITGDDLLTDGPCTVWLSARPRTDLVDKSVIIESYSDGNNKLVIQIKNDGALRVNYVYSSTSEAVTSINLMTCDNSTWTRLGISWQQVAGNDMAVKVGANGWEEADKDINTWDVSHQPDDITLGENLFGGSAGTIDIDDVYVVSGWQATDPL